MDTTYTPYLTNGVAVKPVYKNKSYSYDSNDTVEPNTFYMCAGIKTSPDGTNNWARHDGIIYKQINTTKFTGIPLTKSYKEF
jgi:hypothetical protein